MCSAARIGSRGPAARRIGPHTRSTTKGVTATAAFPQDGERNIVAAATAESAPPVSVDLDTPLPSHPELVRGRLENGFEYVIIPNRSPPNRFEAHLQVCMPFNLCASAAACHFAPPSFGPKAVQISGVTEAFPNNTRDDTHINSVRPSIVIDVGCM